jgi:acetoin utilization protein AcuB
MKISTYMSTRLITTSPDTTVKDAFLTMRGNRVRHLPVVQGNELVGIISDRDLRRPRWVDAMDDWTTYYQINDETTVDAVMTKNPEVVHTYERIFRAVRIFREQRYGALPVLDKNEELAGIISPHDLLGALEELLAKEQGK